MEATTDAEASSLLSGSLDAYLSGVVNPAGEFCCPSGPTCSRSVPLGHGFAAGQLSYVGSRYATKVGELDHRVLVVSMQVGDAEAPVTMGRRSEQVRLRIDQNPGARNAHMRGVTYALQYLHGLDPATDGERLEDGTHVLDAFAMANSVLCSALPTGGSSRRGGPSPTMLQECSQHLRTTIDLLRPTVIHSQGRSTNPRVATTDSAIRSIATSIQPVNEWVSRVRIGEVDSVWCSLPHPSSGPPSAWQHLGHAFHQDVAAPSLKLARTLSLSAAPAGAAR